MKRIIISKRERRHKKVRAKIFSENLRPRVSVFRSNRYLSAQIIDDLKGETIASISTKGITGKTDMEKVKSAGKSLAQDAVKKGVKEVVFDRGGYLYSGKIKILAESLREGGLKF